MSQAGILANWALSDLKPEDIAKETQNLIKDTKASYDKIGSLSNDTITFDNCIKPLIDLIREQITLETPLEFAQHCAKSKEVRDASYEASKKLSEFNVEIAMREDIFEKLCIFRDQVGFSDLSPEEKRFIEKEIICGKRNGLHLNEEERAKIKEIKKKISDLSSDFRFNLNEDTSFEVFHCDELIGVPDDLVKTFEKTQDGKLKVTMKYPHFFPVTRKCRNPVTRKRMERTYQSRCLKANTKILEELIVLRDQKAKLLGYESHAAYVQELRMAKNPERVADFLFGLVKKFHPIWEKERDVLLKLKREECEKYNYDFSGNLESWDVRYYVTKVEELHYAVDQQKLKEYFPIQKVTQGLLQIYQELLGLTFVQITEKDVWHEDVELYRVDDAQSKETLGYFFLDLHPRDGKYGHAAIFDLQPSCLRLDGTRQISVCAMMTNFAKPTEDKPSLLDHGEVETYFHEFGHVMHMICSRTETARFRGTNVERDFVEAPSQMLENWVWEEESLKKMSGHYKDGSEIPKELLDKLMKSRLANFAAFNMRQIILCTFDQKIHTTSEADTQKLYQRTYKEIMGIEPIPDTNMPASWGHMVGYDAQYYGYLWSEVFSLDMFETRFRKEGLLNPKVGMDYRTKILQPGGSKDADDLLKDFLGRSATEDAFLKAKGLTK